MDRNWNQFLIVYHTATVPSPVLPDECPNCGREIRWGWVLEELEQPVDDPLCVCIRRIPRPDQTVFCPHCEAQILN